MSATFKVTQKYHSKGILLDLQAYFSCGTICIDNRKENSYKFLVSNLDDLTNIIIPHFDKYNLISSKHLDFVYFILLVGLLAGGTSKANMSLILSVKNNMNSKRVFSERWNFFIETPINIKAEWLQAFIDGEGSFQFLMYNTVNRGKPYLVTYFTLEIAQSSHSVRFLEAIKLYLAAGYLKPKYDIFSLKAAKRSRSVNRLVISDSSIVINFVDIYPMLTRKHLYYLDWKNLVKLKKEGAHKSVEGRLKMSTIKNSMNSFRLDKLVKNESS